MPMPLSFTVNEAVSGPADQEMVIRPPSGVYLTALSTRLSRIWVKDSSSIQTSHFWSYPSSTIV